jgi:alpha 1,3-glucosidase
MWQDPFTLIIALDKSGSASGQLYLDDGAGYGYEAGEYVWKQFHFASSGMGGSLTSTHMSTSADWSSTEVQAESNAWAQAISHVKIERIVILGLKAKPKAIKAEGAEPEWSWEDGLASNTKKEGMGSRLVIKNPGVGVVGTWGIVLQWS